ncbi:hypothetical protein SCUCBS95973_007525 [Sporothrix curviconia]|uniref:Uncharacterized protein n=1 Tax=Sporothrix curviconia TaxID=1260050 RepID=A0ABP0CDY5_9PEZI
MDFFMSVKDTLRQFRSPPRVAYDLPYVSPRDAPTSNMPLGKSVWLMGSKKEVGSITHTFDCPSNSRPYPSGYQHDLSLITKTDGDADDLSLLGSTSGLPLVDGWANIQEALDGAPLFVASTVAYTNDTTISHGTLTGKQAQDDLHAHVQQAIAEGTQYTWDPETLAQSPQRR